MVAQQTVRMDNDGKPLNSAFNVFKELLSVSVTPEYLLPRISSIDHMVIRSGVFNTQWPSHIPQPPISLVTFPKNSQSYKQPIADYSCAINIEVLRPDPYVPVLCNL